MLTFAYLQRLFCSEIEPLIFDQVENTAIRCLINLTIKTFVSVKRQIKNIVLAFVSSLAMKL